VTDAEGNSVTNNESYYPTALKVCNASLIAAAPELLEALQQLVAVTEDYNDGGAVNDIEAMIRFGEALDNAKAVIAKATNGK